MDPTFALPFLQGLRCIDTEKIKVVIGFLRTKTRVFKPIGGKLISAIRHVPAPENSQF